MGRTILKDSDNSWNRMPFQVEFGEQFKSMADALRYMANVYGGEVKYAGGGNGLENDEVLAEYFGFPNYLGKPYFRDTRLGANDAINCIWQFNRDDDIVHESTRSDPNVDIGMGRVYASTTEQNQTIAWFTFGLPRFTRILDFYKDAFDAELIKLNQTGFNEKGLAGLIGQAIGTLVIYIPTLPFRWLADFATRLQDFNVDKFYDLRSTMHLYYKYVDSVLAHWIVSTGLYGQGSSDGMSGKSNFTADPGALPLAMRETGVSIYDIMKRRATMVGMSPSTNISQYEEDLKKITKDDYAEQYDLDTTSVWSWMHKDWTNLLKQSAIGTTQFVGFRVEKDTDASESFSNSSAPSEVAERINAQIREVQAKKFALGTASGNELNTGTVMDTVAQGLSGLLTGMSEIFKFEGLTSAVMTGAYIDIPEQYKSSDFNKSHNLSFKLRSPYGDVVSIYQSIIVPLAMFMAAALPRAAGANSYVQPFLCRVYCKGLFSIPMGLIESLTIRRGSSEFGWTYQNLPTCVDVNMTIKDMSPIMFMNINDSALENPFTANNNFKEFMLTLAGTGLMERISRWSHVRNGLQVACHNLRNRIANPMYHASWIGESTLMQLPFSLLPWNGRPSN